jgi:hypothetical protein
MAAIRPHWEWILADGAGRRLEPNRSPVFTSRFDAEQWLGERWRTLAAEGAASAQLVHDGTPVAASMELRIPT